MALDRTARGRVPASVPGPRRLRRFRRAAIASCAGRPRASPARRCQHLLLDQVLPLAAQPIRVASCSTRALSTSRGWGAVAICRPDRQRQIDAGRGAWGWAGAPLMTDDCLASTSVVPPLGLPVIPDCGSGATRLEDWSSRISTRTARGPLHCEAAVRAGRRSISIGSRAGWRGLRPRPPASAQRARRDRPSLALRDRLMALASLHSRARCRRPPPVGRTCSAASDARSSHVPVVRLNLRDSRRQVPRCRDWMCWRIRGPWLRSAG